MNFNKPGVYTLPDEEVEEEVLVTPEISEQPIEEAQEPIEEEVLQQQDAQIEQPPEQELENAGEEKPGVYAVKEEEPETPEQQEQGLWSFYEKGVSESVSGMIQDFLVSDIPAKQRPVVKNPGFFQNLVQGAGTLTGDLPYMMAGATIGTALGSSGGVLAAVTGGFGALALPTFLKEAMRQYRDYQNQGNDLTFGEFIQRASEVGNSTLKEGALGATLGVVAKGLPQLSKIPLLKDLFNTKYVGTPIRKTVETGIESGVATTIPAISQGEIPKPEDAAQALILFAGMKSSRLPAQLPDVIRNYRGKGINTALAAQIQAENLAFPPLIELKGGRVTPYENSLALDRNLAIFNESVINNITEKVNALSPVDLESTHNAGVLLQTMLLGNTPDSVPLPPTPAAPTLTEVPLLRNPLTRAIETISPRTSETAVQKGREIKEAFHRSRDAELQPLNERFDLLEEVTNTMEFIDTQTPVAIEEFISQFDQSVVPNSPESTLVNRANNILRLFADIDPETGTISGYKNINMRKLIQSNRSLKKLPKWDAQPDVVDNIERITELVDEVIADNLEQFDPAASEEYQNLNADYSNFKRNYDSKNNRILFQREGNNQAVFNHYQKIDNFQQLQRGMGNTPEGNLVLNKIRADAWRNKVGRDVLEAQTETQFAEGVDKINPDTFNEMMEFLDPHQQASVTTEIQNTNQLREAVARNQLANQSAKEIHNATEYVTKKYNEIAREVQTKQKLLTSIMSEDPASLIQNLDTVEGINRTWKALEEIPGGKDAKAALARFETNEMLRFLGEGFIRTGKVPYKDLSISLKNKDFRAKLTALNGPEFVKSLEKLISITDSLSKNYLEYQIKYINDPLTISSAVNITTALGIASGHPIIALATHPIQKTGIRYLTAAKNFWSDKANYDQKNISRAVDAAQSLKYGSKKEIQEQAKKFSPVSTKKKP